MIRLLLGLTALAFVSAPALAQGLCTSDAMCDDGRFCNGLERCAPASSAADSSGCVPADSMPCAPGICDEDSDRCLGSCTDADGDGFEDVACGGSDCDDSDANRYPGNVEICDALGIDEDCDGTTIGDRDADGDGFIDAACYP